ncbi:MAG: hypothetical protein KC503_22930 [Myxococcales bacterium]|nr:hypothetical protein [Myxococcales bacterium]
MPHARRRARPLLDVGAALLLVALLGACSDGTGPRPDAGSDAPPGGRPRALLGGTLADSPWPSDVFLVDGRLRLTSLPIPGKAEAQAQLVAALGELDGAPIKTSIFFRLGEGSGLADGELPATTTATLYDLSAPATPPRQLVLYHRAATRHLVALAPSDLAFEPGHRYACVVGDDVVTAADEMRAALRGEGPHAAVYKPLRDDAATLGVDLARVGAATVFRVGDPAARLAALVAQLGDEPLPSARVRRVIGPAALDDFFGTPRTTRAGLGDPAGVVHDAVGWVVLGDFTSPRFLSGDAGQLGTIGYGADGRALRVGEMTVPFMLVLPADVASRPLPLLIFQHGLNSSRAQVAAVANDFARAGYATIGIDALWHGDRAVSPKDERHNLSGAAGADGLADLDEASAMLRVFAITGDAAAGIAPFDGRAIQDNFRQAVVDIAQLARLLSHADGLAAVARADAALGALRFDRSRVVYSGESFGSILGVLSLATIDTLDAGVLSVGAAGLFTPTFQCSPFFAALLQPLLGGLFDRQLALDRPDSLPGTAQLSLALLQAALEPGDPVAYTARIRASKTSVLLLQAYSDEILPNQAGELLAQQLELHAVRAAARSRPLRYTSLPEVDATLAGNAAAGAATRAVVNVDPGTHGMFSGFVGERQFELGFPPAVRRATPEPIDNPTEWLRAITVRFADSYRRDGLPVVDTRPR